MARTKESQIITMSNMLNDVSTSDEDNNDTSVCANCGKEGDDINNICNKCKKVKYCNAACKKKHRHKHKKECDEHMRQVAELHDEELFKQPPSLHEDCPICMIRLPSMITGTVYMECCGKVICRGCYHAPVYDNQGNKVDNEKCHYCRTLWASSDEEMVKRNEVRVKANDSEAIFHLGVYYRDRRYGFPKDYIKALELFHRSAELGYSMAYNCIGYIYEVGQGVEVDKKKAIYYYELAAMKGDVDGRHNLGCIEEDKGNFERALKHYMIAVAGGNSQSLKAIHELYSDEHATKEDYRKALTLYQTYLGEIKSAHRDEAAAAREDYR